MESVATEILSLLKLGGVSLREVREPLLDGSVNVSYKAPFPLRRLLAYRNGAGALPVNIAVGECLVIAQIDAFNVDWSQAASVVITHSTNSQAQISIPLQVIIDKPLLFIFKAGAVTFTFAATAVPLNTLRFQVIGHRLPRIAQDILGRLATEVITP